MRAIGIDLGTTNSAAAVDGKGILPNRDNEQLTPSVVSYIIKRSKGQGEIVIGRQAANNADRDPLNTIFSIKRLMGRVYGEQWRVYSGTMSIDEIRRHVNYRIADPPPSTDPDQGVKVLLGDKAYTPVDISALILGRIKEGAELALGEPVTHAVITVPAYFDDRQRDATTRAGEQAGLTVLKIIDEPTAAALAFGLGKEQERHRVLVYDLGGGTFDISIIQMTRGQYTVLEMQGDNWLGGDDFDRVIVNRMVRWVRDNYDFDPSEDKTFLAKAKVEAEKTKKALGMQQSVEVFWGPIKNPIDQVSIDILMTITRDEFQEAIRPLVEQTMALVRQALQNQNFAPDDISEVLLVGGATAVPLVQEAVGRLFGSGKVRRQVNPMECVALGAGILAATYDLSGATAAPTPSRGDTRVVEVTHMNLGIAAVSGENPDTFVPIIPKGTPYPLLKPMSKTFRLAEDNQKLIRVPVYEGLSPLASLNVQQGTIDLPLTSGIGASRAVEVWLNYDHNRTITVEVKVVGTDLAIKTTLMRGSARVDRLIDDWREELQPCIRAGQRLRDVYGEYMDPRDLHELNEAIDLGERALSRNQRDEGTRAMDVLNDKIFTSRIASQLFLSDWMMSMPGVSPEFIQSLREAVGRLRKLAKGGDEAEISKLVEYLKLSVDRARSQSAATRRRVGDRKDLNLLRVIEAYGSQKSTGASS